MSVRVERLRRALDRLGEALVAEPTALNRDGAIQRFEFCFELAWRAIQGAARRKGLDCASPRACGRVGFRLRWIDDEPGWLALLEDRNRTSHTYDQHLAREVYG